MVSPKTTRAIGYSLVGALVATMINILNPCSYSYSYNYIYIYRYMYLHHIPQSYYVLLQHLCLKLLVFFGSEPSLGPFFKSVGSSGPPWWSAGTAISVILTTALSALVLQDITLDGTFAAGTVLTIGATFMYSGLLDHLLPQWIL